MRRKRKGTTKGADSKRYEHYKALLSQMSNENQNYRVFKHLMTHESITTYEAFNTYGITRLPSRINDLRNMGIDIDCEIVYKGKKHYGIYRLKEET